MTAEKRIYDIQKRLDPLRSELLNHPIYGHMKSLDRLHVFMEYHVFAVWDFMSLLKALQRQLCGTEIPWTPPANPQVSRFINEVVLGEECDEDGEGGYASHFDLYHAAMCRCGASTAGIDAFLTHLRGGAAVTEAFVASQTPSAVQAFVRETFEVIESEDLCALAATFTFGREDLLPSVFQRIVASLNVTTGGDLDAFQFYLGRHIELDGDHHGPMAMRLVASLCGDDDARWSTVETAAVRSIRARQRLWDDMERAVCRG